MREAAALSDGTLYADGVDLQEVGKGCRKRGRFVLPLATPSEIFGTPA